MHRPKGFGKSYQVQGIWNIATLFVNQTRLINGQERDLLTMFIITMA